MSASAVIFYVLSALIVTFGALTVFTKRIFRAAIFLLLALIGIAGVYILMEMQFVAALQVVVYVGGIVVLIIFSIFLTSSGNDKATPRKWGRVLSAALLSAAGLIFSIGMITTHAFTPAGIAPLDPSVRNIGLQLINYKNFGYVFPFEVVSILLLAALVGSIVIAMKSKNQ
ncbi:MAG: NADH-quinone oxidoreductase subunit J [Bacteroidota bacterium]|nr:NADH-quinone oxidoreductase subunit J [Bacteroidota bacterium]